MQQAESQSVLDDAADAEEDDPETAFNEEGIPYEPFHLHREREVSASVIQVAFFQEAPCGSMPSCPCMCCEAHCELL